jgi:hypothetical protein
MGGLPWQLVALGFLILQYNSERAIEDQRSVWFVVIERILKNVFWCTFLESEYGNCQYCSSQLSYLLH